ncbi:hypothetical protein [uncultured Serinicoccus sp.]|uniref:hypothetical protein n=1 Tax=uncultured Serinicoccus sp. TaxID=735514 RepID=UPI00262CD807|nr:hypothetical protein [uncultured Serinicoccus sp.]
MTTRWGTRSGDPLAADARLGEPTRPVAGEGDGRVRRAVVLIHGIGEQEPTGTLRGFLDGLGLGREAWSKPDRVSDNLELRRMSLYGRSSRRAPTDLYELYWAHHAPTSSAPQVLAWLGRLLRRRSGWAGGPAAPALNVLTLGLLLTVAVAALIAVVMVSREGVRAWLTQPPFWVAAGLAGAQAAVRPLLTRRLADAERYLTPDPSGVAARTDIRTEGLELMRRLHTSGVYDEIAVVGHSLGSVIGYDILRLFWDEARHPTFEKAGPQPEAERLVHDYSDPLGLEAGEVEVFQHVQRRLWRECRERGVPWLVTDFLTLGSPLAHGRLLLDTRASSLQRRQDDLELPMCPPMPSLAPSADADERSASFYPAVLRRGDLERTALVGNHGAPFGPTRWTNLYFPARWLAFGDPVGGPLRGLLGTGIRDVAVHHSGRHHPWWHRLLPLHDHLRYWDPLPGAGRRRAATVECVPTIRAVLGLEPEPGTDPTGDRGDDR